MGIFYIYNMGIQVQKIIDALNQQLPGASSHKKMLPKDRILTIPSADKSKIKRSSVLFLLFPDNNKLQVCLIKRPAHMKYHAGQIALPGGKIEPNETALETALRETREEIGIETGNILILGSLSELYVEVSRFIIHPFVGWLDSKPNFNISTGEVEKLILFPLYEYKNNFGETELDTITGKLTVPCIKYNDEVIWGATAMILSEFYDITNRLMLL